MPSLAYSADAVQFFNKGDALMNSRNYTDAVTAFDNAVALEPTYFEAWDRKADALNRDGRFSEAMTASTKALAINPQYTRGWINHGQILYNIGYYYEDTKHDLQTADTYYAEQLLAYDTAIRIDPGNAEAWFNKGYALAGMKQYDEALAAFDKVQSLDPEYPNLALSQKQATVLRDAATPVYIRYAFPAGIALVLVLLTGYCFWYRKKSGILPENAEQKQKKGERKK